MRAVCKAGNCRVLRFFLKHSPHVSDVVDFSPMRKGSLLGAGETYAPGEKQALGRDGGLGIMGCEKMKLVSLFVTLVCRV